MQCENCTSPAEYQVQQYRFCLACARKFLGYTPGDESKLRLSVNAREEIEDEETGATRQMTQAEREAWESR